MPNSTKPVWPINKRLRVLIADDNRDAADSLAFLMRVWGHDPRVAYDGWAALATTLAYEPQVAFLDLGMPKLDGYQLCVRIRRELHLPDMLLVALTAYSDEESQLRAFWAGFDHHLVKPVDPLQIQMLLSQPLQPGALQADGDNASEALREIDFPTSARFPFHTASRMRLANGLLPGSGESRKRLTPSQ
jgi:CheY-like chemotaxis protein